jgi:hypothetical protein
MKKENIYVEITNETERLRAIEILQNAGEEIRNDYKTDFELIMNFKYVVLSEFGWWISNLTGNRTKITLDKLELLLNPKKSNVFTEVQEWIRENCPEEFFVFRQGKDPDCIVKLQKHLEKDYPKGTEIKISVNEILISNK